MISRREWLFFSLSVAALARCSRSPQRTLATFAAARVVSLSPATTEALFAIGAGGQVVGRTRFCDFPAEASALPAVGGFMDADFEAILSLAPDLVVGPPGPESTRLIAKLEPRGIGTWFPAIDSLASIEAMICGLGERTAHAERARRVASDVESRTLAVERAVAAEPAPRVLLVVGSAPVIAAGPASFLDELIHRAKAINVVTAGTAWQTIELERVVEIDPDVVIDASDDSRDARSPIAARSPGWSQVRAVRTGHVIAMSDSRVLRPGPRVAEGLAVLARALHPNASL